MCNFVARLRPAFPYFTRLLPKTIALHGYTIPKGVSKVEKREVNFCDRYC